MFFVFLCSFPLLVSYWSPNLFGTTNEKLKRSSGMVMSCHVQAGERVWDRVRRECGGNTGSTAPMGLCGLERQLAALPCLAMPCHALPCLAMPCHSSGSQSQIPKSFSVVIRPAWNMIGTVYLLDRPLQAPTILPDLKDTVEEWRQLEIDSFEIGRSVSRWESESIRIWHHLITCTATAPT